jgi:hypothetical protein
MFDVSDKIPVSATAFTKSSRLRRILLTENSLRTIRKGTFHDQAIILLVLSYSLHFHQMH